MKCICTPSVDNRTKMLHRWGGVNFKWSCSTDQSIWKSPSPIQGCIDFKWTNPICRKLSWYKTGHSNYVVGWRSLVSAGGLGCWGLGLSLGLGCSDSVLVKLIQNRSFQVCGRVTDSQCWRTRMLRSLLVLVSVAQDLVLVLDSEGVDSTTPLILIDHSYFQRLSEFWYKVGNSQYVVVCLKYSEGEMILVDHPYF